MEEARQSQTCPCSSLLPREGVLAVSGLSRWLSRGLEGGGECLGLDLQLSPNLEGASMAISAFSCSSFLPQEVRAVSGLSWWLSCGLKGGGACLGLDLAAQC